MSPFVRFVSVATGLLVLAACGRSAPLPVGPQTAKGTIVAADLSLSRRGTHVLVQQGEPLYYVESSVVNLRTLEGREVTIRGILEKNTDRHALPVLVVQTIVAGAEEPKRSWPVPDLGITLSVPRSWIGAVQPRQAVFTQSGSAAPALLVRSEAMMDLPFDFAKASASSGSELHLELLVIGTSKAVAADRDGGGLFTVSIAFPRGMPQAGDHVLTLAFRLQNAVARPQQIQDALSIAKTVQFTNALRSSAFKPFIPAGTGSAAAGIPCGGPAGVLCPAGYFCQVTDTETDIGICKKL